MEINRTKRLDNAQFYSGNYPKFAAFFHDTRSSTFSSAFNWWNTTPARVGTAYIVDRDGTIYEVFDPRGWSWHLGIKGDDNFFEKHAIGVEFVSRGFLHRRRDNSFVWYPLYPNKQQFTTIPENEVYTLTKPWRGYSFYHKYTNKQVEAVKWLIPYLYYNFKIPVQTKYLQTFYKYHADVVSNHLPGFWTHSTVRPEGEDKYDLFPQPNMIKAIQDSLKILKIASKKKKEDYI